MRRLGIALTVLVLLAAGGWGAAVAWGQYREVQVDTVGKVDFDRPLAIPPLADSTVRADGTRVFTLDARAGETDLGQGGMTPTWGYSASILGPTLQARRGEKVEVQVTNSLDETTTVHWHGMHLPAVMDGGPHQVIEPGQTWSPHWTIAQPAATLWYHPHTMGRTLEHVYQGLAGFFLLRDDESDALDLPDTYGVDDVPVVVQDKKFDGDRLDSSRTFLTDLGLLGDTILVNGTPSPYLDVTTESVRLRLLNGSVARTFRFGFDDRRSFAMIASDGGLLAKPVSMEQVRLGPGERAEIVVRVSPGERAVLRSNAEDGGSRLNGDRSQFDVLQLRAADILTPSAALPSTLVEPELPDSSDAVETRTFDISGTTINGRSMSMSRIDEAPVVDTTERWEVVNTDKNLNHTFHVHDVQFRVVSIDGKAPPPELAGRKDTIVLENRRTYVLAVRFADYTDPEHPYMYHCHMLQHEDDGMMGQFVVVKPGEKPVEPTGAPTAHH